jgi:hypothetical protein
MESLDQLGRKELQDRLVRLEQQFFLTLTRVMQGWMEFLAHVGRKALQVLSARQVLQCILRQKLVRKVSREARHLEHF